jgi:hypothetical protein
MPAKSEKQEKFMRAVAHSPSFSKKVGVPMSVGREFTKKEGGMPLKLTSESEKRSSASDESKRKAVSGMKKGGMAESKAMVKKEVSFMKKKGAPKSMIKHEMAEAGMKKGGMAKYAKGGMIAPSKMGSVKTAAPSRDGIAVKGKTQGSMVKMAGNAKGLKKGGYC